MNVRLQSVVHPLDHPEVAGALAAVLRHADAMGLVSQQRGTVERMDMHRLIELLATIAEAGIGQQLLAEVRTAAKSPRRLAALLKHVDDALIESPTPGTEWIRCEEILGSELLSRLLNISESSFRRYRGGARPTPDDVAGRLHFLALVISDLAGAYNDIGVRRWFDRARPQLSAKAPAELLGGEWNPNGPGPSRVRALAESLTASPAT